MAQVSVCLSVCVHICVWVCRWKAAGLDRMRVVPGSCSLELVPAQASSSLHIHARFTMKPDLSQPSIIGQTAHNLDEVKLSCYCSAVSVTSRSLASG